MNNTSVGYISELHSKNNDCAQVYKAFSDHFKVNKKIANGFCLWKAMFELTIQDINKFETFYNTVRTLTSKLESEDSIAISNDLFLHSIMVQVIDVEELKQMTSNFLTSDVPYKLILEEINNKVCSMLATDRLCCTKCTQLVSRKSSVTQMDNQKKSSAAMVTPFPRNQGNQITNEIYKQVKL